MQITDTHAYQHFLEADRTSAYGYGYDGSSRTHRRIDGIRREEFRRLHPSPDNPQGITPLDHGGAALYSETQLQQCFAELQSQLLSNPHSVSDAGSLASQHRESLVRMTLDMCQASSQDYEVVFTSGATAAFKMVAESLPWCQQSVFVHMLATHNSVLGIREVALAAGASVQPVQLSAAHSASSANTQSPNGDSALAHAVLEPAGPAITRSTAKAPTSTRQANGTAPGLPSSHKAVRLAVLPHECNFTGQRIDLRLVSQVKLGAQLAWLDGQPRPHAVGSATAGVHDRWLVMLDAAKSCATGPPDLSQYPADMVALSYYKIFGYPTGLGALIVRKDVLPLLTAHKRYFGGGTVAVSVADADYMVRRPGAPGLEDGTPAFAAIASACHGFKFIKRLGGFPAIAAHTKALCEHLYKQMTSLKHKNGQPLVVAYGRDPAPGIESWGPTVASNLKRSDGSWVGYAEVSKLATLHGIQLRTGCFCNPGACALYLGLTADDMRANYEAGHVCWDAHDLMNGRPTGAVRVSLGHVSTYQDVETFIGFLRHYFLDTETPHAEGSAHTDTTPALQANGHAKDNTHGPLHSSHTNGHSAGVDSAQSPRPQGARLTGIYVYPIKSCAAQQVTRWPIGPTGLLYDREWALLDDQGRVVTQKLCPAAARIVPHIDLERGTLTITSPNVPQPLIVPLRTAAHHDTLTPNASPRDHTTTATTNTTDPRTEPDTLREVRVCGDNVCGLVVAAEVSTTTSASGVSGSSLGNGGTGAKPLSMRAWFQEALGVPCVLIQQRTGDRRARQGTGGTGRAARSAADTNISPPGQPPSTPNPTPTATEPSTATNASGSDALIGFANDGQYLLVNAASVDDVNRRIQASQMARDPEGADLKPVELLRFRPNLVVDGLPPYSEDQWTSVQVGELRCNVLGTCPRCEMLQVDQTSGVRGRPDVLLALAQYRRFNGRMHFGILLSRDSFVSDSSAQGSLLEVAVGDIVSGTFEA